MTIEQGVLTIVLTFVFDKLAPYVMKAFSKKQTTDDKEKLQEAQHKRDIELRQTAAFENLARTMAEMNVRLHHLQKTQDDMFRLGIATDNKTAIILDRVNTQ